MERTSRLLFSVARTLERLRNGVLYAGVGTLRLADLRRAIANSWEHFNDADEDIHSGLMAWEQAFVDRFVTGAERVLVVGSGTGRDLLPLAAMGCGLVGIEPAAQANAVARRRLAESGISPELIDGYFEDVPVPGLFDVIVFSNFCFCYIPGSARRIDALAKARAHLAPGGRVILSYLYRQKPPAGRIVAIGRAMGALTRSDWRMETGDAFARSGVAMPSLNYEHMFGPGEMEAEANAAGLSLAGRGGHPHHEPWAVFVAD